MICANCNGTLICGMTGLTCAWCENGEMADDRALAYVESLRRQALDGRVSGQLSETDSAEMVETANAVRALASQKFH